MTTEPKNMPWVVRDCGNPKHEPDWHCHSVRDSTGERILDSVTREQAEHFASVPSLREQVRTLTAERDEWKARAESRQGEIERLLKARQEDWHGKQNEAAAYEQDRDTLRARVAELERELTAVRQNNASTMDRITREHAELLHEVVPSLRQRAEDAESTARDAALEEAADLLNNLPHHLRATFGQLAGRVLALKAQPARRCPGCVKCCVNKQQACPDDGRG